VFKNAYGVGIKDYITKMRMDEARLLLEKGYSVYNTACAVGYGDSSNFSKAYKKHFGNSPSKKAPNNA
jgi:transcriptional regulator GlxA family with amidase domain